MKNKHRPILFNTEMVRAILDGTKTRTRRIAKPQPETFKCGVPFTVAGLPTSPLKCPLGETGDRLWVRETWFPERLDWREAPCEVRYRADGSKTPFAKPWRPSIHMPRWASRITLEITGVRIERLQNISDGEAKREGFQGGHGSIPGYLYNATPVEHFIHVWSEIYGEGSFENNPWVWVIEFRRTEGHR